MLQEKEKKEKLAEIEAMKAAGTYIEPKGFSFCVWSRYFNIRSS